MTATHIHIPYATAKTMPTKLNAFITTYKRTFQYGRPNMYIYPLGRISEPFSTL